MLLFNGKKRIPISLGLSFRSLVLRRLLAVCVLVIAIFSVSIVAYKIFGHQVDYTPPSTLSHPFWLIIIAQFIGAAGEEFGWRCFLQPLFQTKLGVLPSSILVGLLWGAGIMFTLRDCCLPSHL
ncbi:CPBP family intramembrane glutamic endopeptidase [Paenibacillus sp. YAF4_2]|uniref:CPBP family intramembrane glutamic endopeptidase n=1 Tax=Paenibacillus sp. YAF4_2 TaxID=3233085 RepID=UPI003F9E8223